jgi:NitT/TauT family transport system substrate-binding protein
MRLKPGAKVFLAIVFLVLIGVGAYQLGWLGPLMRVVAPERKPAGAVGKDDFTFGNAKQGTTQNAGQTSTDQTTPPPTADKPGKLSRPIRVGIVMYGGFAGGLLENGGKPASRESAFYKNHGVQVEFVQIDDLGELTNAFNAGGDANGVDIMATTVDMFAMQYSALEALKPVTIMQTDWSRGADAIAVAKGITSAAGLKGKQVAVAEASPSHFLLLYILAQAGLSQNDIKPVFTTSALDAADVFKAGKVDACVSWSPNVYMAADARPGATILASTREATSLLGGTLVARGDFCNNHGDDLVKFLKGWFEGVTQAEQDNDAAARVLVSSFEGIKLEDAQGMLMDVKLQNAADNRSFFHLGGETAVGYDELCTSAVKIWKKVGLLEQTVRPDITRNTYFLDEATKQVKGQEPITAQEFPFKAPKEETKTQQPIVTKRITVYFASNSAVLDPNAQLVLEQAAELAQTFGSAYLRISGNTDSKGSRQANMDLSKRRAQAVVDFIVSKYNFPRDKFIVVGNGPDKPVAGNDTEEGRAKNRRTDFEVIPQEQ